MVFMASARLLSRASAFRDFVARQTAQGAYANPANHVDPVEDIAWHTVLELVLAPHPDLPDGQKRRSNSDYGMKDGSATLRTRRALAFLCGSNTRTGATPRTTGKRSRLVLVNEHDIMPLLEILTWQLTRATS